MPNPLHRKFQEDGTNVVLLHVGEAPTLDAGSVLYHPATERRDNRLFTRRDPKFLFCAFEISVCGLFAYREYLADFPFGFSGGVPLEALPLTA